MSARRRLIECNKMITELENIIRAASYYGSDTSYYENQLTFWKNEKETAFKECQIDRGMT